jgi:hypothetical protein
MIKKIAAIIAAAGCAGAIVTFVPGFALEVAAGATQPTEQTLSAVEMHASMPARPARPSAEDIRKAVEQNILNGSRSRKIVCNQSWPYYEHSCLRNVQRADAPRAVRVVGADRSTAVRLRR